MYILDRDHLSILQRGGITSLPLRLRLSLIDPQSVFTTIITYEEQTRGWLSYRAQNNYINAQIQAYKELQQHLINYNYISVIGFDENSALEFQRLKKNYPRIGTMDLKIAAITITHQGILLPRNVSDFGKISGLNVEDWTIEIGNL
jgi:tRNA(fMet)-specific endonuclease VapC